jgi:ATP-binding cassette subfamily G (WHITE) protein 2
VFTRERSAGLYRLSAYFLAVMTTEIPVTFLLPTIYTCINYFMVNLMPGAVNFIAHWLILVLSTFAAQSIGMFISVAITSRAFVMSFSNTFMIASLLAGGYYNTHVKSWFKWVRYLSYLTYSLSGLAQMEFTHGTPLACASPLNASSFRDYCVLENSTIPGEVFLNTWDLNFVPIWGDVIALVTVIVMCRVAAYFVLRYLRRPKT